VPPKGEKLPKKGEELPSARIRRERAREYAQAIAKALKDEQTRGTSIKTIMAWTGAGERTVKDWLGRLDRSARIPGKMSYAVVRPGL